jgi:V/A-type H+-transporting ATPase subunit K
MRRTHALLLVAVGAIGVLALAGIAVLLLPAVPAAQESAFTESLIPAGVLQWGYLAAAIAAGLAALAAGYAVGMVGSAAVGALAEKPELLGRVLILVGLAEGIAIYGLIIAILILNRLI